MTGIPVGERAFLKEAVLRLVMLAKILGANAAVLPPVGALLRVRRSHPVENGFAWHHTLEHLIFPAVRLGYGALLGRNWVEVSRRCKSAIRPTGGKCNMGNIWQCALDAPPISPSA